MLLASGDVRIIRVWDVNREQRIQDIPIGANDIRVTSLTSADIEQNLCAAGCSDGSVRVFDRRLPTSECRILTLRDLRTSVVGAHLRHNSSRSNLVAASMDGQICLWEPRMFQDPIMSVKLLDEGKAITAFDAHYEAELIVIATSQPFIHVVNHSGRLVNTIKNPEGIASLPHRSFGAVKVLQFHPLRINFASACSDGCSSIFSV